MKFNTRLSFIPATLFVSTFAQAADKTFINCMMRVPRGFSPTLVMDGISYNASSKQVYNCVIEFKHGSTEVEPVLA